MPNESIKPSVASNSSRDPVLKYINTKPRVKFDGSCLKQDKVTFTHKQVVLIYTVYEMYLWPFTVGKDFTLVNSLFGTVKLTKNTDFDKYVYILDMVLDLMLAEVFCYAMVVGLVKL